MCRGSGNRTVGVDKLEQLDLAQADRPLPIKIDTQRQPCHRSGLACCRAASIGQKPPDGTARHVGHGIRLA